jgi:hypothetical protein
VERCDGRTNADAVLAMASMTRRAVCDAIMFLYSRCMLLLRSVVESVEYVGLICALGVVDGVCGLIRL